ncbi:pulmonary surfactant-associated protein A-like [Branchiostoma lanceolatum]|uniref:pulmonary surfactant-associated protein A-like n=1 Tax=Branchiostoma lanceolatum TaxID=7740 RepID=UPI0034541015
MTASGKTGPIMPGDARSNGPVGPPGPSGPLGPPGQPAVPLSAGPTYPTLPDHLNVLKRTFGTISCPGGYAMFREMCYKVFKTQQSFGEASATCCANGGTLAMPRDAQTNDFLISLYLKSVNNIELVVRPARPV